MSWENLIKQYPLRKSFRVVAVSDNMNSFGLRGVVMVARDGEAYQVGANYLNVPKVNDDIVLPQKENGELLFAYKSYEIPEKLTPPCQKMIMEVYPEIKN